MPWYVSVLALMVRLSDQELLYTVLKFLLILKCLRGVCYIGATEGGIVLVLSWGFLWQSWTLEIYISIHEGLLI